MTANTVVRSSDTRVWTMEGGVSPLNAPVYQGCMKIGDPSQSLGDVTPIKCPDPSQFGKFVEVGTIRGAAERVTSSLMARYNRQLSALMTMARKGCRVDIQAHVGACANPQDYKNGWEKIVVFRNSLLTNKGIENFGALSDDENNPTNDTADFSAAEWYEIVKLGFAQVAGALSVRRIVSINICDAIQCGECGETSGGDQKIFATMIGQGATPGTKPSVLYSNDGGDTWAASIISTLFSNEVVVEGACIGSNYVVAANDSVSLHYAPTADILAGTAIWTEVISGFVAAGKPTAMWSVDPQTTWIVGEGGYVYFTTDPTVGVSVQDAGVATTQILRDIHAFDTQHAIAVGDNNALIYTINGGETWQALTGPAAGEHLYACWMLSDYVWLIGTSTGALWATKNQGTSWNEVSLPSSVIRIDAIKFVDDTVGYLAAREGGSGVMYRTTSGGNQWHKLPEDGLMPDADYFEEIAVSPYNPNLVFAGGLDGDGSTGIIVKGAGK